MFRLINTNYQYSQFTLIIQEKVVSTLLLFYILKNKEKQTEINKHRCNRNQHYSLVCRTGLPTVLRCLQPSVTQSPLHSLAASGNSSSHCSQARLLFCYPPPLPTKDTFLGVHLTQNSFSNTLHIQNFAI